MRKIFLAILVICSSPVFGDIWDVKDIDYTPVSLGSVTIPAGINEEYFRRKGDEKQYFYTGQLRGQKGTVIFLLGAKTWDVIAASILIHETKVYIPGKGSFFLYRPEELARDIQSVEYRIQMSYIRRYTSGSLFDFYKKKFPGLTLIIFSDRYYSSWYPQPGQTAKPIKTVFE